MKVIVIGGGIMGLSIALELRRTPNIEVLVLERSIPGAEASTAAAGMLAPQFENPGPGPMIELGLHSRRVWPKWAGELERQTGIALGFAQCGGLQVAMSADEASTLAAKVEWQQSQGLRAEWVPRAALNRKEPALGPKIHAAASFPDEMQVDPHQLLRALVVATSRAGVQFRTGTVRALCEKNETITGVDVDGQVLEAGAVVLAAGAWSGLVKGAEVDPARIKPVRGQMLELQVPVPLFSHILKSSAGYLVPRADGRVIVGSTMEMVGFDKRVTAEGIAKLLAAAIDMVPPLGQAQFTHTWAGLRPWTDDQLPFLGAGPKAGLLLATGHFRNGILLAPITAQLLGQCLRGETPTVDLATFGYRRKAL